MYRLGKCCFPAWRGQWLPSSHAEDGTKRHGSPTDGQADRRTTPPAPLALPLPPGQEQEGLAGIRSVRVAKRVDEVVFLQLDADEDIGGGCYRGEQMSNAHDRRRPEREQKAQHDGMTNQLIEALLLETDWCHGLILHEAGTLPPPEQVEMMDHERGEQEHQPAEPEQRPDDRAAHSRIEAPDDGGQGPPLPIHKAQEETGAQHIGASLDRTGKEPRPPAFEGGSGHDTMLQSEQTKEHGIEQHGWQGWTSRPGVDRFRHEQVAHKPDGVQKREEEEDIRQSPVEQGQAFTDAPSSPGCLCVCGHTFSLLSKLNSCTLFHWYPNASQVLRRESLP